jgi:hypothetical protein
MLDLDANTMAMIKAGEYNYDITISTSNSVVRIFEGVVTVSPQVTR